MTKTNKVKAKEKSVIVTLESLQAMAASEKLDGALMVAEIPKLASPTKVKPNRFSRLIPFDRSTFDYEKYCVSLAADSMEQKPHKE
ncbi:hypothetical protein GTP56_05370 [Duganella sp. FT134W]|uniref:Uncharacterized protein n=1 Tax=Duganella margarita TaxID=2692170 RepID=A0A7X4GYP4_9BURK|nr:hypothetical protein [Duganella margarita]MYM71626.1 hypothetical protein [Duganella margarita]